MNTVPSSSASSHESMQQSSSPTKRTADAVEVAGKDVKKIRLDSWEMLGKLIENNQSTLQAVATLFAKYKAPDGREETSPIMATLSLSAGEPQIHVNNFLAYLQQSPPVPLQEREQFVALACKNGLIEPDAALLGKEVYDAVEQNNYHLLTALCTAQDRYIPVVRNALLKANLSPNLIDPTHYTKSTVSTGIPTPGPEMQEKLETLLTVFDSLNWDDPEKADYVGPKAMHREDKVWSRNELQELLETLIRNVKVRQVRRGTPSVSNPDLLDAFYRPIENAGSYIAHAFVNNPNITPQAKAEILVDLAVSMYHSAGRIAAETQRLYAEVCRDEGNDRTFEKKIFEILSEMRGLILQSINSDVHFYNACLMGIGKELGIMGSEVQFFDPYGRQISKDAMWKEFMKCYTPQAVVEWLRDGIGQDAELRGEFVVFIKTHMPDALSNEELEALVHKQVIDLEVVRRMAEKLQILSTL